jgi:hypothetical protein
MERNQPPIHNNLLENPDISNFYDLCLSAEFTDDTAYLQALLTLVHACDLAYGDENAGHSPQTIIDVGLALANIHDQTGHYEYCLGELDFLFTECSVLGDETRVKINGIFVSINSKMIRRQTQTVPCPVSAKILVD